MAMNPYIVKNLLSQQRTGTTGMKSTLPQRFYGNQIQRPQAALPEFTGAEITPSKLEESVPLSPGPGIHGLESSQVASMPNSVQSGVLSQDTANAIEGAAQKGITGIASMIGTPVFGAVVNNAISKGKPSTPTGKLVKGIAEGLGEADTLGEVGQSSENAVDAALQASIQPQESIDIDVDFPDIPESALADLDFGGDTGEDGDSGVAPTGAPSGESPSAAAALGIW